MDSDERLGNHAGSSLKKLFLRWRFSVGALPPPRESWTFVEEDWEPLWPLEVLRTSPPLNCLLKWRRVLHTEELIPQHTLTFRFIVILHTE